MIASVRSAVFGMLFSEEDIFLFKIFQNYLREALDKSLSRKLQKILSSNIILENELTF